MNCPPGTVVVYDSLLSMSVKCTQKSSKAIVSSDEMARAELEVRFVDLEHQVGSKDCGLFAITFSQVLCDNIDHHLTGHYQKIMREHLSVPKKRRL